MLEIGGARELMVSLVEGVMLVIQVHWENKVILESLETGGQWENAVLMGQSVCGEGEVTLVPQDREVSRVQLDSQVHVDHPGLLDHLDLMVQLVWLAKKAQRASVAVRAPLELQERQESKVLRETWVPEEPQEHWENRDSQVHQEILVIQVLLEKWVSLESQELKAHLVTLVQRGQEEAQAQLDPEAQTEKRATEELLETQVSKVSLDKGETKEKEAMQERRE